MDKKFEKKLSFSDRRDFISLSKKLETLVNEKFIPDEKKNFFSLLRNGLKSETNPYDEQGFAKSVLSLKSAILFAEEVEPDHNIILTIVLYPLLREGVTDIISVKKLWGEDVAGMLTGLESADRFSHKNNFANNENFRGLLLSMTDDIRVIIIMIVRHLALMREINLYPDETWVKGIAFEGNFLYSQLAHRLGLYKLKSELEDLSLKYSNREIYMQIAHKLNATKKNREAYIKSFIEPLKEKLHEAGLKFDIKGRTKSISSIWNKMKKQRIDLQGIYDLFAIRVIIDTPPDKEKADCWLAYSILADMYTANPARMRDWITIPKSNGYESLHATVMGPESKWVEVQFRTKRMDLVAEKGLAAHWRYKGVKSDSTDQWMNNIRDILESADHGPMEMMRDIKMQQAGKEVFAFTPKGDLFKLPEGATILDFAFQIHTSIGSKCTGAVVNGKHRKINYKISNGDTVEILTSSNQKPAPDWLNIVRTNKARNKIRQCLNDDIQQRAELGKEIFERRVKNRKVEIDDRTFTKYITKKGYKYTNDFYSDIQAGKIDVLKFITSYIEDTGLKHELPKISAEEFHLKKDEKEGKEELSSDILSIGEKNIKGINYKFAKCCSPVYGDNVFGFISSDGTIKIHREICPNALNILKRYPYRIIKTQWSGKVGEMLPATLRVIGTDDIGIVANITSVISKEFGVNMRNISVESNDGFFQGILVINVKDSKTLNSLIKKIKTIKGIKNVERI